MLFTEFKVGEKEYKLRLNTRDIVNLEKNLGCNPMAIFGDGDTLPTITQMVHILHSSMQQYQHGITLEKCFAIFDEWLADNHTMSDFYAVIIAIYRVSGLLPAENDEADEKN